MIVYTPIDLPKLEPDDWDVFWDIWNTHKDYLVKTKSSIPSSATPVGANDLWQGLDILKKPMAATAWQAPFVDIKDVLPNMYNSLITLLPDANIIRLVQSQKHFKAHTDDNKNIWYLRAYLHYTSPKAQWYFTKPNDPYGDRTYIDLPESTNWFAYNDCYCWHGTDFDPENKKILVQVFWNGVSPALLQQSIDKYNDYTIDF